MKGKIKKRGDKRMNKVKTMEIGKLPNEILQTLT